MKPNILTLVACAYAIGVAVAERIDPGTSGFVVAVPHDDIEFSPPINTHPANRPPTPPPTISVDHAGDEKGTPRPTSYATDPDPSKTVYCTTPHNPTLRLVQYALMIDAGSTGSRIHIYKFNNCGPSPMYEYETFNMTQPGFVRYPRQPQKAAQSLDVLLDLAVKIVPESMRGCTPVAVKATAALRLMGAKQSAEILEAVRERLHNVYPFQLQDVVITDEKDTVVYAWIAANYLLNTIRADTPRDTPTYAVLLHGGWSTQIVFEPTFSAPDASLAEGEHKYDLKFGGKTHVLYQHLYLGYGLTSARLRVHRLVDFMASQRIGVDPAKPVGNPCLAKGTSRVVEIWDEQTRKERIVTMAGEDVGGFEACSRIVQLVMAKDAICELKPCSFDGVYQPSLLDTFPSGKVLLLSYFYDRISPLVPKDDHPPITVSTIASMAQDVCLGKPAWINRWGHDKNAMEELEGHPEYCLDLTFMHRLLRLGYEFEDDRTVTTSKKIEGTELGWCLGATIAMVGGDLKCRV